MDKHTESDSRRVEEALSEVFHAVTPNPSFVAELEQQLLSRMEEQMMPQDVQDRPPPPAPPPILREGSSSPPLVLGEGPGVEAAGMPAGAGRTQTVEPRSQVGGFWANLVGLFTAKARLSWAVVVLVAFLFLGSVTVATSPMMSQLFGLEPGLRGVDLSGLYHEIKQSQSINGVTVTVERAYADANRIVIAVMVETENEQQEVGGEMLTDKAGSQFPQIGGMGVSGPSEFMEVPLPPEVSMHVLSFDANSVQGEPAELELQFSIQLRQRVLSPQQPAPEESASPESAEVEMVLLEDIGEYRFDFTVPFLAAERVQVQQSVELERVSTQLCPHGSIRCTSGEPIKNLSVQLEQLSITPSEMQAKLCVNLPAEWRQDWFFAASVESESGQKMPSAGSRQGERCQRVRFLGYFIDRPADIRLSVNEIIVWEEQLNQRRLQGPWRFQFEIP